MDCYEKMLEEGRKNVKENYGLLIRIEPIISKKVF